MKRGLDRPTCRRERETLFRRVLAFLGFRFHQKLCGDLPFNERPPDAFVREPRRPRPIAPGGAVALELPDLDSLT
jgi:hypothetical protein